MTKIAVMIGSLRHDSYNKKLADNLERLAPEGVAFVHADISEIPLYNHDREADFPVSAQTLKELITSADGVLVITPEYNRSIPGVLKNAIDWASRPSGSNSFDGKPAGIVGASISPLGTAPAQAHLKDILVYLNTKLMGQPELYLSLSRDRFDETGTIIVESKEFLERYITAFISHVESYKK